MLTPETEAPVKNCMNLRNLIDEKREQIGELEQDIEDLNARVTVVERFGPPGVVPESRTKLVDKQRELEIAKRQLEDLLNDFELSECRSILS